MVIDVAPGARRRAGGVRVVRGDRHRVAFDATKASSGIDEMPLRSSARPALTCG
ncbi:hypothetical protein VAB18032_19505 [Micromonospora maris AB-18-032]|nr:hypothetical protein VAB18032_19505 [Micromonospora maris AB-18-032]